LYIRYINLDEERGRESESVRDRESERERERERGRQNRGANLTKGRIEIYCSNGIRKDEVKKANGSNAGRHKCAQ